MTARGASAPATFALPAVHTTNGAWVKLDTTGLWQSQGGHAPSGSVVTIDGTDANTLYGLTQPTAAAPIQYWLLPIGTHAFVFDRYTASLDVYWRGYPWTYQLSDAALSGNALFFNGPVSGNAVVPTSANGGAAGAPYLNGGGIINNGYSVNPDAGATSAVFVVAPGDEGWVTSGIPTADTRVEENFTDTYAPTGNPTGGIDLLANGNLGLRVFRYDYAIPTSFTAPATVQNTSASAILTTLSSALSTGAPITSLPIAATLWGVGGTNPATLTLDDGAGHTQTWTASAAIALGATSISVVSQTPSFAFPSGTSVKISWFQYQNSFGQGFKWPDGVTTNPATGNTSASALVVNSASTAPTLSNLMENQGPAVFVWASGATGGANGALRFRYQPTSAGLALVSPTIDSLNIVLDSRVSTIVEYQAGLFATTNGVPWLVSDASDSHISQLGAGVNYTVTTTGIDANVVGSGKLFTSSMVGQRFGIAGVSGLFTVATFTDATHITMTATIPTAVTSVNMYQLPFCPYGVPPTPPYGGGWFRTWRYISGTWTCTTAGNALAVAGTPTIDASGNVIGDPVTGADAGKIFGPTEKVNGAVLASGPNGASGTVLLSTTSPPFDIVVSNVVSSTNFHTTGGWVALGSEMMKFSSYTSGTKTLHITARAQLGTPTSDHLQGDQVLGMSDILVLSPGPNQGHLVPVPQAVRIWPPIVSPTVAAVIGAPTTNYP